MSDALIKKVREVFREVFQDPGLMIAEDQTAADIAGWDSLTHMTLIAGLEDVFSIRFTFEEVNQFKTIGDMLRCISSKVRE